MIVKYICLVCFAFFLAANLFGNLFAQAEQKVEQKKEVRWPEIAYSGGYIVEVQDTDGKQIAKQQVRRPPWSFSALPGTYRLRIAVLDRWGKQQDFSDWFPIEVEAPPPPEDLVEEQTEEQLAEEQADSTEAEEQVQPAPSLAEQPTEAPQPAEELPEELPEEEPQLARVRPQQKIPKKKSEPAWQANEFYAEFYAYDVGGVAFNQYQTVSYDLVFKSRLGIADIFSTGISLGLNLENFILNQKVNLDEGLEHYNVESSPLYFLDISYQLMMGSGFYMVLRTYPIALFHQAITVTRNNRGRITYNSPFRYLADSNGDVTLPQSALEAEGQFEFYQPVWNYLSGAAIGLQYYSDDYPIAGLLLAHIWVGYAPLSVMQVSLELAVGIRFQAAPAKKAAEPAKKSEKPAESA